MITLQASIMAVSFKVETPCPVKHSCTYCICNIRSPRSVLQLWASWQTGQNKGKAESSAACMTRTSSDTLHRWSTLHPFKNHQRVRVKGFHLVYFILTVTVRHIQ